MGFQTAQKESTYGITLQKRGIRRQRNHYQGLHTKAHTEQIYHLKLLSVLFFYLLSESNHLKKFNVTLTPNQLAKDFKRLRQYLKESFPGSKPMLVGPDVTQPRGNALKYLRK